MIYELESIGVDVGRGKIEKDTYPFLLNHVYRAYGYCIFIWV